MNKTLYQSNEKPFIAIAGEIHNSNSSCLSAMLPVWEKAKTLGMNTILLPASWELIEPEEGVFTFDLIDGLLTQAREHNMKLIFLWFGTWKNAQSSYVPAWVKTDLERFPRAQMVKGKNKIKLTEFFNFSYTSLSYLGEETKKADAKAFARFMSHLKDVDEAQKTVIGVQVENETGVQGAAREHSDLADAKFNEFVPEEFASYMKANTSSMHPEIKKAVLSGKESGTWKEVFGDAADELFSAYYIASYIEEVAKAGKSCYNLPLTVNSWLDKGDKPGIYPSGGPVAKVMEVWKYAAPSIDAYAPDIYVQNFHEICDEYLKLNNPLCIPETAIHSYAAPRLVHCVGHYHASCFAPFGFEDMGNPFTPVQGVLFGMDVNDPLYATPQNVEEYGWCSKTLCSMMDLLTQRYGTNRLQAAICECPDGHTLDFGDIYFQIDMENSMLRRKDGVCLILRENEDTFYILGNGCCINPESANPEKPEVDMLLFEEGEFINGQWIPGRRLNGDEASNFMFDHYMLTKLKLFTFK